MRRAPLLVLASMLLLPLGAGHAQRVTAVSGQALPELDSATSAVLLHEMERASARGLPVEPLVAKVREGRLKRASGARIRQAVAALATRLDSSRAALGPAASTGELAAGADAIAAGATAASLRAIRDAAAQHALTVPLGALAQLVASGVPPARATAMVVDLLRRSVAAAQIVAFGNAVESDAAGGLPAEESAIFRLRAVSAASADAVLADGSPTASTVHPLPPYSPPASTSPRRRP